MTPKAERKERNYSTESKRKETEKDGEESEACILNMAHSYTPFMLGSIFLVPDCMGMTFATLAAERLVVLGEPVGALFVGSCYRHIKICFRIIKCNKITNKKINRMRGRLT